jgi:hypothetical protein
MATRAEIAKKIREKAPDISDDKLKIAVDYFVENPNKYNPEKLILPFEALEMVEAGVPLAGGAALLKGGVKAVGELAKTFGKKKVVTEGAEEAVKKTGKKVITKKRVLGAVAVGGAAEIYNRMSQDGAQPQTPEEMAEASQAIAAQTMIDTGQDPNGVLTSPMAQQLNITTGSDLSALASKYGLSLGSASSVYLGPSGRFEEVQRTVPTRRSSPTYKKEIDSVSLADWNKQFPIANPAELAAFKKRVVSAGVVSAGAGVSQLKTAWEALGQLSVDAARSGSKMTPWQMLDIQRGLFGGGGEDGPSYSLTYTPEETVKNIYTTASARGTGKILTPEEEKEFAAYIKQKESKAPTKSETKMINGKKVRVTTPGFTDADITAAAEARVQKDPRYAEYQTASVFGDALSKALGVRG